MSLIQRMNILTGINKNVISDQLQAAKDSSIDYFVADSRWVNNIILNKKSVILDSSNTIIFPSLDTLHYSEINTLMKVISTSTNMIWVVTQRFEVIDIIIDYYDDINFYRCDINEVVYLQGDQLRSLREIGIEVR